MMQLRGIVQSRKLQKKTMAKHLEFEQLTAIAQHLLESRSGWEWKHCLSVGSIAFHFANHLRKLKAELLSEQQAQTLYKAGLLHDIGKINSMDKALSFIPPEAITQPYLDQIHAHPSTGMRFLADFCDDPEITRLVAGHHCRLPHISGSVQKDYGYPADYCKTIEMDLSLTILALADTFDSICVTERPYTVKRSRDEALREINHMALRGALDKDVTEWFCSWAKNA